MNELKQENIRIDICILRMLMCFCVVLCHFGGNIEEQPFIFKIFYYIRGYAVPVFMLMSFYLSANMILNGNGEKWKKRIVRLIIPQIGWAIIYFVVYMIIAKLGLYELDIHFSSLIWQIFTGHSSALNPTMWFQTDLILLTLIFFLLSYLLKNRKSFFITINLLLIISLIIQYSGLNTYLFDDLRFELKYPLGRFFEVMPCAVLGLDFYQIHCQINETSIRKLVLLILLAISTPFTYKFINCTGFGYQGITPLILSIFAFEFFTSIPFEKLPYTVKNFLIKISHFTLGIYCMHRLIATILMGVANIFRIATNWNSISGFLFCVIIYVICYITSYIINLAPNKYIKQLVS